MGLYIYCFMQHFCQGSTREFGNILSYQKYKIGEVGSGI